MQEMLGIFGKRRVNMSEKAWYIDFRPRTLDDYKGEDIVEKIRSRFSREENDRPHVIFVHGNHGCGKTTVMRILTKYYMCENPKEDGTPCEECEMCKQINDILISGETGVEVEGIKEINGVVANGKGLVQEVMEEALQEPIYTKYKIIIFDECHKMTDAAQNSLLKDLEDIPSHLIVMFGTTEPDKVIDTIKSRVHMDLEVHKKTDQQICDLLLSIAKIKGVTTSKEALKLISKKGDRIPRDCITLLETVAKTYGMQVTVDNVKKCTASVGEELYIEYFQACKKGLASLLEFNCKLKELEIDCNKFISGLSRFIMDCMYIMYGIKLEEYDREFCKCAKVLFNDYTNITFDNLMKIIEETNKSITTDDNKNELIITSMGMKLFNIDTLYNGKDGFKSELEVDNDRSIKKFVSKEKSNIEAKSNIEKINSKVALSSALDDVFKDSIETLSDDNNDEYVLSAQDVAKLLTDSSDDTTDDESDDEFEIPEYLKETE